MSSERLAEFVRLLTCHGLASAELNETVCKIENGRQNQELDFLAEIDVDDALYTAVGLQFELSDFNACSDKIDELHEQLSEQFAEPLPEFPERFWGEPVDLYFEWLDGALATRAIEHGGYRLLLLEPGLDDNLVAFAVYRRDVPRIQELASEYGISLTPAFFPA
jgi:hypothetical protein